MAIPCPDGHEIYKFGGPFLGHYYSTVNLSDLCLVVDKKIYKEIMHFHYITYMTTPHHKSPCPGGRPFLGHHFYTPVLYGPCPEVEKKLGWEGPKIYNFLSFYPTDGTFQIWSRLT